MLCPGRAEEQEEACSVGLARHALHSFLGLLKVPQLCLRMSWPCSHGRCSTSDHQVQLVSKDWLLMELL